MRKQKQFQLPSIPLKKAEAVMAILVRGHQTLKALHLRIQRHLRAVSGNPFKRYSCRRLRREFFQIQKFCALFNCPMELYGLKIPQQAVDRILAVQAKEEEVIFAFTRMVRELANRRYRGVKGSCYGDDDDLEAEGYLGVLDAIYGYDGRNKFSTYCHYCVNHRIGVAINRTHNNYPWPKSLRRLYQRYEIAISQNTELSMNGVLDTMKLTDKQRLRLQACMTEVHSATDVAFMYKNKKSSSGERNDDYTVLASTVSHYRPAETLDPEQLRAINATDLSDWEKAVMEGYLSGHYGWQSEVARNFGKSRRAPAVALERIKRKVLAQLVHKPEAA